jgi:hypothetical protein
MMKRMIFCLLTIIFSAEMLPALVLPTGNNNEKVQLTGTQYFADAQPKTVNFEGLNIRLPDTWQISNNSGKLVALAPDNTACTLMKPIDLHALDPGLPDFPVFGEKFVQEFRTTHKLTLMKPIMLPLTFWASTNVPFDWKKLVATIDVPFDWKSFSFGVGSSDIRQSEPSQIKIITIEGVGKLGASERWASITVIGLPNGRVLLLFSVSGLEKSVMDANRQVFDKILLSLQPE